MSTPNTNVLASGIQIIGSIRFQNDMHIDGKIDGKIESESGKVIIGELADIKGDIKATSPVVPSSTATSQPPSSRWTKAPVSPVAPRSVKPFSNLKAILTARGDRVGLSLLFYSRVLILL